MPKTLPRRERRLHRRTNGEIGRHSPCHETAGQIRCHCVAVRNRISTWLHTCDVATIHGKQRANGSLALINYQVSDTGILFVGLFTVQRPGSTLDSFVFLTGVGVNCCSYDRFLRITKGGD